MTKPTIVFVDDEANILGGLQRLFRSRRDSWDMVFLNGGEETIEWLADNDPDAIVTDMRMPVVDGGEVLKRASEMKKGKVRFVLSGEADRQLTYRTVGASHQFFSKPCNDAYLSRALDNALTLGSELLPDELQIIIGNQRALPAPTTTHDSLEEVFLNEGGIEDITRIAAQDPSLALRLLQLANSSYFGRPADTLSIAAAARQLGCETIRNLWDRNRLLVFNEDSDVDASLASIAANAVESARNVFEICSANGASDRECEDGYALGLIAWTGDALGCGVCPELNWSARIRASAYMATLYGLPSHMAFTMEMLARGALIQTDASTRASEIGDILFEATRAA